MIKKKLKVEVTREEANLILLGLQEILSKEEHGSEKIAVVDSIHNAIDIVFHAVDLGRD
tara:strand:+ start:3962 stop:4138 length:177 start_codon:yes stop_codon:yes gene_type:complete